MSTPRKARVVEKEEPEEVVIVEESVADDASDIFDGWAEGEDVKLYCSRLNPDTGNYAFCGVLAAPGSVEEMARRYGGGAFKVRARRGGKFVRYGTVEIDSEIFPPTTPKNAVSTLTQSPDRDMLGLTDRMSRIETLLLQGGQPSPPQAQPPTMLETLQILQTIQQGSTGSSQMLEAIRTGLELGKSAAGGEKGLADVAAEVVPELLKTVRERNAALFNRDLAGMKAKQAQPRKASPAPSSGPPKPGEGESVNTLFLIRRIVGQAKAGAPPEDVAVSALDMLPASVIGELSSTPPHGVIRQIMTAMPGESAFLASPKALDWVTKFLAALRGEGDIQEETAVDAEPEGEIVDVEPEGEIETRDTAGEAVVETGRGASDT